MTTRTFQLASLSAPFSWSALRGLVDDVNRREPASQHAISCRLAGAVLLVEMQRELTPLEEAQERAAAGEKLAAELRSLFQADGTPVPDALDRLRRIAGV